MQVICEVAGCDYNKGGFCKRDKGFTVLNGFGQCKIFWGNNGQPRPQPMYPAAGEESQTENKEESKQEAEE